MTKNSSKNSYALSFERCRHEILKLQLICIFICINGRHGFPDTHACGLTFTSVQCPESRVVHCMYEFMYIIQFSICFHVPCFCLRCPHEQFKCFFMNSLCICSLGTMIYCTTLCSIGEYKQKKIPIRVGLRVNFKNL